MTTFHCFVTVETKDGKTALSLWRGKRGAAKLKSAVRAHYREKPGVARFSMGNVWSVNFYGAH